MSELQKRSLPNEATISDVAPISALPLVGRWAKETSFSSGADAPRTRGQLHGNSCTATQAEDQIIPPASRDNEVNGEVLLELTMVCR
jgi:hypothetical protein